MKRTMLTRPRVNKAVLLAAAAVAAIVASAAFADSFIYRRPLQGSPATSALPDSGEEQGAESDGFDPGPLRVGGVPLGRGPSTTLVGEDQTFLFGILASGGVPPYTLSISGDAASDPRIFYRAENFAPDEPVINLGGSKSCGPGTGDMLCLFDRVRSGTRGTMAILPGTQPQYRYMTSSAFRYAEVVSGCETDIAGSQPLNEIFANQAAEQNDDGVSFAASQISLQGEFSWCGGYDDKSMLAAVEMDLAPYVKTSPGDHDYLFTVTDAAGLTASTSATIRIHAEPIVLATAQATLTVGKAYTGADKLIDLEGGFGTLTVDYADERRVPGMDLVDGQLEGTPFEAGEWTLALEATDQSGQSRVVLLAVAVEMDCGEPMVFSTAGTFAYTAPDGCSTIFAEAWGGGANGAAGDSSIGGRGGSGGGGGAYASATFSASASSYAIVVGAAGKDSSVREGSTNLVLAKAGSGTKGGSKFQSTGDTTISGGQGGASGLAGAGDGGDAAGAGGGAGGKWSRRAGVDGQAPGGGGSGGDTGYPSGYAGGAGAVGRVIIQAMP